MVIEYCSRETILCIIIVFFSYNRFTIHIKCLDFLNIFFKHISSDILGIE